MNELEKQFEIMKKLTEPQSEVHQAFIEMTKLIEMFYRYLESKFNDSDVSK